MTTSSNHYDSRVDIKALTCLHVRRHARVLHLSLDISITVAGFDYSHLGDSNWTNCNSVRQQSVSMSDCMCFQKQQFNIFNVYIWYLAFCSELTTGESWNGLVQMKIFFHCYLCMTSSSSPACMFNKITLNGFNKEEAISGKVWLHAFSY